MNEAGFPDRFDDVAQGVVDDASTEGSGADQAAFRFVDGEVGVTTGTVTVLL